MGRRDIGEFFKKKSRSFYGGLLRLKALPANGETKWAFMVSSSVKKNAVARNLTRRRMAEAAGDIQGKMKKGYYLVFFFKLENKKAPSYQGLKGDMIKTLSLCGAL